MKEFIDRYPEAFCLFNNFGFKDPIMHSRNWGPNKDNVLILVTDLYTEEEESKPQVRRLGNLKRALKEFISCDMLIFTPDELQPRTVENLQKPSSEDRVLHLTANLSDSDEKKRSLEKELIKIFGEEWVNNGAFQAAKQPESSPVVFFEPAKKTAEVITVERVIFLMKQLVDKDPKTASRLEEEAIKLKSDVAAKKLVK